MKELRDSMPLLTIGFISFLAFLSSVIHMIFGVPLLILFLISFVVFAALFTWSIWQMFCKDGK